MTRTLLTTLCLLLTLVYESSANPIISARINTSKSNQITVSFDRSVRVSDAKGFRLIGGAARIERLISGSGTQQLTFQLTDYVLPDDEFTLVYWGGLGDAVVDKKSLTDTDPIKVTNSVDKYQGSGTVYYVSSSSGNDQNDGLSSQKPLKSIDRAQDRVKPGDYVLLKRGDQWNTRLIVKKSGSKGQYITYASYGKGAKPIIMSALYGVDIVRGMEITMATIAIRGVNYIQIDNIHVKTSGTGSNRTKDDGIQIGDGAKYAIVSNCIAQGIASHGNWGIRVTVGKLPNTTYPQVLNSEVFNYFANLGTQLWPYDGKHGIEEGGLIENCISRDPIPANNIVKAPWENLMINRGNFNGFVIRKNKVYNYAISGIETFGAKNVVVEYNEVYNPLGFSQGGRAIKAGGYNDPGQTAPGIGELYSENIIVRFNKVHDITRGNKDHVNAIDVNNTKSGEIYGNLIYNVRNHGIKIPSIPTSRGWRVHHNTVIGCGEDAIHVYASGPNAANVTIFNNIVQGNKFDINCVVNGTSKKVAGKNNILLNNRAGGRYQGEGDTGGNLANLFVNASKRDYRLAKGSSAIDKGTKISDYLRDQTGVAISGQPDIGAFEYPGETTAPPAANLSVNAGSDVTVTLPTNRASFQAQASGTNGASVSYRWTKNSGPSATLNNTTSAKLELQNAQEGTYVLSVTASANGKTASDEVRLIVKPSNDSNPPSPAPSPSPAPPTSSKNGLRYKYYEGTWMTLPNFGSLSVRKQGIVSNFDLGVREQSDHFGMVFTGSIDIKSSGAYTFYTKSDDGSKLFIDGKQVVNNDGLHGPRENSGKITLSAGRHSIEVQFFERTIGEVLEVRYAGPGISKQRIPSSVLYLDGNTPPSNPTPEPAPKPKPNPTPPASEVTANAGSDKNVSANSTISLSGSGKGPNPFRGYAWQKVSGPSVQIKNQNTANVQLSNLQSGTYVFRFTATDSEGNSASDDMTLRVSGSNARLAGSAKNKVAGEAQADQLTLDAKLFAFPNPADRSLTVRVPNGLTQSGVLVMTDLSGRVVRQLDQSLTSDSQQLQLDTSDLPSGTYLLKLQGGQSEAIKIMINH